MLCLMLTIRGGVFCFASGPTRLLANNTLFSLCNSAVKMQPMNHLVSSCRMCIE